MKRTLSILVMALAVSALAHQGTRQISDAKLKQLKAEYKTTKAAYAKKPKDVATKKKYVDATFALGMGTMYAETLTPHEKYAGALAYFREVLKVEPKHKLAKENYDLIAGIYKKMHMPVPGEKDKGKGEKH
ncbi:MAG: hypothetical protein JST51_17445 [Armatimonadetes bacterium]|nr:hypothetical protein [Armatimonadota bacterium]